MILWREIILYLEKNYTLFGNLPVQHCIKYCRIDKIRYPPCWPIQGALRVKKLDYCPPPPKKKNYAIIVRVDPGTCDILHTMHHNSVKMEDI